MRGKEFQRLNRSAECLARSSQKGSRAFTLVELMVVVVILGILAATILPQIMSTPQEARVGAAKAHVSELENAVNRFYLHMDRYPSPEEGLKVLVDAPANDESKKWRGPYINQLRNDPWDHPYQYRAPGARHPNSFDVWSQGKDGADGGEGDNADIGNW